MQNSLLLSRSYSKHSCCSSLVVVQGRCPAFSRGLGLATTLDCLDQDSAEGSLAATWSERGRLAPLEVLG